MLEEDKKIILADYRNFESNKSFYLDTRHLFIRDLGNKLVIYKFGTSKSLDQNSRKVFALLGGSILGIDYEFTAINKRYIIPYLYYNFIDSAAYKYDIYDQTDNASKIVALSIDGIYDFYRKIIPHQQVVADIVKYCCHNMSFVVHNDSVRLLDDMAFEHQSQIFQYANNGEQPISIANDICLENSAAQPQVRLKKKMSLFAKLKILFHHKKSKS
jgi:hypothetical protein